MNYHSSSRREFSTNLLPAIRMLIDYRHRKIARWVIGVLGAVSVICIYIKVKGQMETSEFILRMTAFRNPPTVTNSDLQKPVPMGTYNLMIISYMRGGSSMSGQIFRDNAEDFYVYEPLIPFAPYQYFTENRFCEMDTLKCSVWAEADAGEKVKERIQKVVNTLKNIYSCNIRELEDGVLRTIMFQNANGQSKSSKSWFDFTTCYLYLTEPKDTDFAQYFRNASFVSSERHKNVMRFLKRTGPKAEIFRTCLNKLESECRASRLRVTKVLRISLRIAPLLLTQFPNLNIAFIMRDPRGNINSRIMTKWFPVNGSNIAEVDNSVQSLCFKMKEDIKMVDILKRDFPGRFVDIRLEDIVKSPVLSLSKVFNSLGTKLTSGHEKVVSEIFVAKPNFDTQWKSSLKENFVKQIEKQCQSVLKFYNYKMVHS